MLIWLDDERRAPHGYTLVKTANECLKVLRECRQRVIEVEAVSLDRDLGPRDGGHTGSDLVDMLECDDELLALLPQTVRIHSYNPAGAQYMARVLERCGITPLVLPYDVVKDGGAEVHLNYD